MRLLNTIRAAALATAAIVAAAPLAIETVSAGTLDEIKARGSLRVGMSAAYKPFEFVEGEQIVGLDPDHRR